MRKELIWAAVVGISLGLVIAFGVWRVNANLKPKNNLINNTPRPKANPSEFQIVLDKPQNNDVVVEGAITVSGITKPLSWITVSGEEEDYFIQADDKGVFVQETNLISGINQIKVTAFDAEGGQSVEKVLVVYSSAFEIKTSTTVTSDATTEASIRQKVEAKVESLLNKPKAYIGTVTDITDSTIQIKTMESEIKQISTAASDIAVVKTGPTSKTVKLTDIAIGDFIVGMGYINSSSVLSAQRILITDPIVEPNVSATFGTTADIDKKAVVSKTLKTKLTKITEEEQIIFVVTQDKEVSTVRSIFVIQKS